MCENNENDNNKTTEENIESYIVFNLLGKEMETNSNVKEELLEHWKNNKLQLMEPKINILKELEKEKFDLENNNNNEESKYKRKYNHMKAYVDHCLEKVQNEMTIEDNKTNTDNTDETKVVNSNK